MESDTEFYEVAQDKEFVFKLMTMLIDIIMSDQFLDSNETECLYNLMQQFDFTSDEDYKSIYQELRLRGKNRDYKQSLRNLLAGVEKKEQIDIIKDAAMFMMMGDGEVDDSESEIYEFLLFKLKQLKLSD